MQRHAHRSKQAQRETVWILTDSNHGASFYIEVPVSEWGAIGTANQGQPLITRPGFFAYFVKSFKRQSPYTCQCVGCKKAYQNQQRPLHEKGDYRGKLKYR